MSRKNHKLIDGKLLQMDKRYSQLKMKQQEKISDWYYQAYRRAYYKSGKLPDARQEDDILFDLMRTAGLYATLCYLLPKAVIPYGYLQLYVPNNTTMFYHMSIQ